MNGSDSVVQTVLLNKLFGGGGGLDLSEDTGRARVGTIILAIQTMASNPLGVGHETFGLMRSFDDIAGGGGGWFAMGASEGILPFVLLPLVVYLPMLRSMTSITSKVSTLFVCIYCSMAQSYAFMPLYVAVAVLCQFCFLRDSENAAVAVGLRRFDEYRVNPLCKDCPEVNLGEKNNV